MLDYNKVCWYCGGTDLKDMGTHVVCRECGATWNELSKPEQIGVERAVIELSTPSGPVKVHTYHPTRSAKRRIAKARLT